MYETPQPIQPLSLSADTPPQAEHLLDELLGNKLWHLGLIYLWLVECDNGIELKQYKGPEC